MTTAMPWGEVRGRAVHRFVIDGGDGVTACVSDYGARMTELLVPDRSGASADIVLGFDDVESYVQAPGYLGATVGRYGNRIAAGRFTLLGHDLQVDQNEGANQLHGGRHGWDAQVWDADPSANGRSVTFGLTSPDGDMGFPGTCVATSTYELDGRTLRIVMTATPDATTVVNMVHHSYFNLAGHDSGDVLDHELRIAADCYLPVDAALIPNGEVRAVADTEFDFTRTRAIGSHAGARGAYDHNWCLTGPRDERGLIEVADVLEPVSGRRLRMSSTEPGVQVYTGAHLNAAFIGKGGRPYRAYAGFAMESQKFPNSPNVVHFPSATVLAGETYEHVMVLDLSAE